MNNSNNTTTGATHHNVKYSQCTWKGRNKYVKYMKLYIGAEWYKGCLLLIVTIMVYAFCIMYVIPPVMNGSVWKWIINVLYTCVFICTGALCVMCITGDPGVLPMNDFYNKEMLFRRNSTEDSDNKYKSKRINKQYVLNGRKYKMKFCNTCLIYRPLRCSHCKICNVCIERYDHHCPWVGNCIGRNNYVYFYFYVLSFTLYTLMSLVFTIIYGKQCLHCIKNKHIATCAIFISFNSHNEISMSVYVKQIIDLIVIVVLFCSFCFLVVLFGFHTRYLINNETTAFRAKYESENYVYGNPYNKGIVSNIKKVLFTKYIKRKVFNIKHAVSVSFEQNAITDYDDQKLKKVFMDGKIIQGDSSQTFFMKNKDIVGLINNANTNNSNHKGNTTYNKNVNSKQSSLLNTQISQREHLFGNGRIIKRKKLSQRVLENAVNFQEFEEISSEKEKEVKNKVNLERSNNECLNWNNYSNVCECDNNSSLTSARDKSTNLISNVYFNKSNYGTNTKRDNQYTQSNALIESGMVEPSNTIQPNKNLNSIP